MVRSKDLARAAAASRRRAREEERRAKIEEGHARARAEEKEKEARAQRDKARVWYAQARETVNALLTEVGYDRLAPVPHMTGVRRRLLEKALHYYLAPLAAATASPFLHLCESSRPARNQRRGGGRIRATAGVLP